MPGQTISCRQAAVCARQKAASTLGSVMPIATRSRRVKSGLGALTRRHVPRVRLAAHPSCDKRNEGCSDGPSRASRTEGEPWGSIAGLLSRSTSPRPSMRWRSPRLAALAKSGSWARWRTRRQGSSGPSRSLPLVWPIAGLFDAGPTGYGLYRQIQELGHDCLVIAPTLIPKRAGERVKTNRRDAVTLARLHRAGELTGFGCRTRCTRRSAIWSVHGRRRWTTCAAAGKCHAARGSRRR